MLRKACQGLVKLRKLCHGLSAAFQSPNELFPLSIDCFLFNGQSDLLSWQLLNLHC